MELSRVVEISADEDETKHGEHGDEREDKSVFRETLSFLAVKDRKHVASFRKATVGVRRATRLEVLTSWR